MYTCLFGSRGTNLMPLVRHNRSREDLSRKIHEVWAARKDRYSEERSGLLQVEGAGSKREKVEMYQIGG